MVTEVLWPGCAALMLAALVACCAAQHALDREHARLQEARWHDVLTGARQQLEAELALGFDLEDSQRAERLLESALQASDDLQELTIFDAGGVTLFATDRSAIGEPARDAWRLAAGEAAWRIAAGDTVAIGVPLHGPSGAIVGQLALTLSAPKGSYPWPAMAAMALTLAAIAALWMLLPMAGVARALQPSPCTGCRLDEAEARVARADDALRAAPDAPTP